MVRMGVQLIPQRHRCAATCESGQLRVPIAITGESISHSSESDGWPILLPVGKFAREHGCPAQESYLHVHSRTLARVGPLHFVVCRSQL